MSAQNELPGLLKQSILSLEILIEVFPNVELEELGLSLFRAYHNKYLLSRRIHELDNIMLKPVYKQETDSYLLNYKSLVIRLFTRLQQLPSHSHAEDLYNSILNILDETADKEIMAASKGVLRNLLRQVV